VLVIFLESVVGWCDCDGLFLMRANSFAPAVQQYQSIGKTSNMTGLVDGRNSRIDLKNDNNYFQTPCLPDILS